MADNTLVAAVRAAATPAVETVPVAQHQTDLATARAEAHAAGVKEGAEKGHAEGVREGAEAERARIASILDSDAAKGRESLARHFAFATDTGSDAALAALAAAPVASEAPKTPSLLAEMSSLKQPAINAEGGVAPEMSDFDKGAAAAKALLGK